MLISYYPKSNRWRVAGKFANKERVRIAAAAEGLTDEFRVLSFVISDQAKIFGKHDVEDVEKVVLNDLQKQDWYLPAFEDMKASYSKKAEKPRKNVKNMPGTEPESVGVRTTGPKIIDDLTPVDVDVSMAASLSNEPERTVLGFLANNPVLVAVLCALVAAIGSFFLFS